MQDTGFVVDDKYIRPSKAYSIMKSVQKLGKTVYIEGDTGYGKTSFVRTYLANKDYEYYSCNDIDVADILDLIDKTKKIVVLDDFQNIDEILKQECFDFIEQMTISSNVWLIIISRAKIPSWLKPLHIKYVFEVIGEKELEFTEYEEEQYFERWSLSPMQITKEKIRELCGGHPLFIKVCMVRLRTLENNLDYKEIDERIYDEFKMIEIAREDFWDYINVYVFDNLDIAIQEFLIQVCVIDEFTLHMAQIITKKNDAGTLISKIQELGNFLKHETKDGDIIFSLRPAAKNALMRRLFNRYPGSYAKE